MNGIVWYSVFMGPSQVEDPEQLKYLKIMFDFAYLKNPEDFENMINSNTVKLTRILFCGCSLAVWTCLTSRYDGVGIAGYR